MHPSRSHERGSALIFILLAVALFAALIFAVTQGGRDSTSNLSADQQKLLATEIVDYGNTIKSAVSMLRLRGIGPAAVSFAAPGIGTYGTAPTTEIFNPAGGAVVYQIPAPDALTSQINVLEFSSFDEISGVGTTCGTVACTETILWINNILPAVCAEINSIIGVENNGNDAPASSVSMDVAGAATSYNTALTDSAFIGKNAACGVFGSEDAYYQVLIAR